MPITASDILFKLSIKTGAAGNASAQPSVNESLGKYISTTAITDASLNNLFDDVSGDENAANDVEYRCFFIHNAHATLSWQTPFIWVSNQVSGGALLEIAVDNVAASAIGASGAQADLVANESTAPASPTLSFSAPASKGNGLAVGTIPAGYCKAIWVRRTCSNSDAKDNDGATFTVEGDTAQ